MKNIFSKSLFAILSIGFFSSCTSSKNTSFQNTHAEEQTLAATSKNEPAEQSDLEVTDSQEDVDVAIAPDDTDNATDTDSEWNDEYQ